MRPRGWLAGAAVLAAGLAAIAVGARPAAAQPPPFARSVLNTRHNLAASGPGRARSHSEPEICVFCHTPHNAAPAAALWNRAERGTTYQPYTSSTLDASVGQPTGTSKLCLSCHDGTVALGAVLSRAGPIVVETAQGRIPVGPGLIGTDLRDDHPISFVYDGFLATTDGQLKLPGTLVNEVRLDGNQELQCTSCHDPHNNQYGKFLVMSNTRSALCLECHQRRGWDFSDHKLSGATWNGSGTDPWPTTDELTVQDNACENCHQPHSAPSFDLLLHAEAEEDNCLPCHNGNVAPLDVEADFRKLERHPVTLTTAVHEPDENVLTMPRHVECVDCHNPHAARDSAAAPPDVPGALEDVTGITSTGTLTLQASYTYEICFKCHADSPNNPGPAFPRQVTTANTRVEFGPTSASYHPVVNPGLNPNVPSLVPPYNTTSIISCTDCHNSDTGPGAGGSGPAGPHGSIYAPLLERRYDTLPSVSESPTAYALCYKCHSRDSILNDESFREHSRHIREENASCSVCHDAHGIGGQGTALSNSHLINFRTDVVSPNSAGDLEFVDQGVFQGTCSLMCHGEDHVNESY